MLSFRADRSTSRLAASRRCAAAAFALLVMALGPQPVWADTGAPLGVSVENASEPVLCAEADNVTLKFTSPKVRKFRIVGTHPAYFGSLREDNWDADWTACDFGPEAPKPAAPAAGKPEPVKQIQRVTLYEDPEQWIVGWRYPHFWRSSGAVFKVGDRAEKDLHLIQLWRLRPNGGEEVLVFYPQDGYWRARPLAPKGRDLTAYGSSFLVGPVEIAGRPIVRFSEIVFDPKARRFDLTFAAGGKGSLTVAELTDHKIALDVAFDAPISGKPFAALRSMYVTQVNNDVARVAALSAGGQGWKEAGILDYKGGDVIQLWAGRAVPSRHNTSAPDMTFKAFSADAK